MQMWQYLLSKYFQSTYPAQKLCVRTHLRVSVNPPGDSNACMGLTAHRLQYKMGYTQSLSPEGLMDFIRCGSSNMSAWQASLRSSYRQVQQGPCHLKTGSVWCVVLNKHFQFQERGNSFIQIQLLPACMIHVCRIEALMCSTSHHYGTLEIVPGHFLQLIY